MSQSSSVFGLKVVYYFLSKKIFSLPNQSLLSRAARGTLTSSRAVLSFYTTNYVYHVYNYFPIPITYVRQCTSILNQSQSASITAENEDQEEKELDTPKFLHLVPKTHIPKNPKIYLFTL